MSNEPIYGLIRQMKRSNPNGFTAPMGGEEVGAGLVVLRRQTTVTLRWAGQRLDLGRSTRVTQAVSRVERRPSRWVAPLRDQLQRPLEQEAP